MTATIPRHNPPGYPKVDDLTDANQAIWSSQAISVWTSAAIKNKKLTQFFDGTVTKFDTSQPGASIGPWIGFPGTIIDQGLTGDEARKAADESRSEQDEYLEWSVERLPSQKGSKNLMPIKRVVFTCEGPEYWEFLATRQPDKATELTKKLNLGNRAFDKQFQSKDLYPDGKYKRDNIWNRDTTTGTILHLIQGANTLQAEVNLAADATVIRKMGEKIVTDQAQLIECSQYGGKTRNSDPKIGSIVNTLARKGAKVSLKDPIGLYIHSFARDSFKLPYDPKKQEYSLSGSDLATPPVETFKFPRGDINKNQGLRIQVEIPAGTKIRDGQELRQANVSDLKDTNFNNDNVKYGSHFAEYIQVHLYGIVIEGGKAAEPLPCVSAQTEGLLSTTALEPITEFGSRRTS